MERNPQTTPSTVLPLGSETVIVVPCYNESERLPVADFERYIARNDCVRFIFVNDGSTDQTALRLADLASRNPKRFEFLDLKENGGKAEAIRQGFLHALEHEFDVIGFWDADLSTPLQPIEEFRRVIDLNASIEMVIGSRLPLLGRNINRKPFRRLLGRLFATAASMTLGLHIRDTQCGAKMFRRTPNLKQAFSKPFLAKWIFDVELIARYVQLHHQTNTSVAFVYEQPLDRWEEVGGSRLKSGDFLTALIDLARIYWRHMRPGAAPYLGTHPEHTPQDVPETDSHHQKHAA